MKVHELKTWPEYFEPIVRGVKTFEIRLNDRDFKAGDILELKEYEPDDGGYTGREVTAFVSYVMYSKARSGGEGDPLHGLGYRYVIMSIEVRHIQQ